MVQLTLRIDGMSCGMCESHVNDTIRQKFNVKKVTSSHKKGETVIMDRNCQNDYNKRINIIIV